MGHWSLTTAVWIQLACKFIVHLYLIKLHNPNQSNFMDNYPTGEIISAIMV